MMGVSQWEKMRNSEVKSLGVIESGGTADEEEVEVARSRDKDGCIPCAQMLVNE